MTIGGGTSQGTDPITRSGRGDGGAAAASYLAAGVRGGRTDRLVPAGLALCLASLVGFAVLQYAIPADHSSRWGENYAGARHFQQGLLGRVGPPLPRPVFVVMARILLGGAWAGYAIVLAAGLARGVPRYASTLSAVGAIGVATALGCPPSLSEDAYSYVAYGRMKAYYAINPYAAPPTSLAAFGDETARISRCGLPSVYGPVWTQLCVAEAAALQWAGLWWQVVGLKLLGAAALTLAAAAGRAVAEHHFPGRGNLAFLAIGLNPLNVIEGPGNGHCDLLMMALVLAAEALRLRGYSSRGDLALGLAIGVKFLPAALLPWLLLERCRRRAPVEALRASAAMLLLALAPSMIAFAPLRRDAAIFSAIERRSLWGTSLTDAELQQMSRQFAVDRLPSPAPRLAVLALLQWPVVDLYLLPTAWLLSGRDPSRRLSAWTFLAIGLITWTMTARYPVVHDLAPGHISDPVGRPRHRAVDRMPGILHRDDVQLHFDTFDLLLNGPRWPGVAQGDHAGQGEGPTSRRTWRARMVDPDRSRNVGAAAPVSRLQGCCPLFPANPGGGNDAEPCGASATAGWTGLHPYRIAGGRLHPRPADRAPAASGPIGPRDVQATAMSGQSETDRHLAGELRVRPPSLPLWHGRLRPARLRAALVVPFAIAGLPGAGSAVPFAQLRRDPVAARPLVQREEPDGVDDPDRRVSVPVRHRCDRSRPGRPARPQQLPGVRRHSAEQPLGRPAHRGRDRSQRRHVLVPKLGQAVQPL